MNLSTSPSIKKYFDDLRARVDEIYELANRARKAGIDPETRVESPPALDMAGRVEELVGPPNVATRIRQLKEAGVDQDQLTFTIADEILEGKFGKFELERALELAVRVGLAIKTEGVVSAPLEGISAIKLRDDGEGGKYLSIYYAGPIRAAGGTVAAFSVLLADYVRRKANIPRFRATPREAARMAEEVKLYDRIMNLQYPSTPEEIEKATMNLPVEINGDRTEQREVSANRDLPRIETNFVRGGACLVLNDGILLKASKLLKIVEAKGLKGWDWLKDLKHHEEGGTGREKEGEYGGGLYDGKGGEGRQDAEGDASDQRLGATPRTASNHPKIEPNEKYIADIIAGRPVFGYPSRRGGFRVRYGRSRNTGLAACGVHPATMEILGGFLAIGTQIRIERPGKSSSTMPVDSIEGPVVKLKDGSVKQVRTHDEACELKERVEEVLFLGDILFGYGEFAENNHPLVPSGYCEEWWALDLADALGIDATGNDGASSVAWPEELKNVAPDLPPLGELLSDPLSVTVGVDSAVFLSERLNVPLHPRFLHHWNNLSPQEVVELRNWLLSGTLSGRGASASIMLPPPPSTQDGRLKELLERACVPHDVEGGGVLLKPPEAAALCRLFSLPTDGKNLDSNESAWEPGPGEDAVEFLSRASGLPIRDKAPYYMGTRMGRPEKAKERRMNPPVHSLFPLGHDVDPKRLLKDAGVRGVVQVDVAVKRCPSCRQVTFLNSCPACGSHTQFTRVCNECKKILKPDAERCPNCGRATKYHATRKVDVKKLLRAAGERIRTSPPNVKGVKGLTSDYKVPEALEKGLLRAKHGVFVYKDGTARVDSTDVPLTHFTPTEVRVPVEKLRQLGYERDIQDKPLKRPDQILELKVQDVLVPLNCAEYLVRVSKFVDDELQYLYGLEPFYNARDENDLVGAIVVGLAPHTSAGIVGRIVGFTEAHSGYAHPYWHAAKRRNCDGDEDAVMLLLEMLLNFSKYYLPAKIGGKMDAPLVVSVLLDPLEVDAEAHNVDCAWQYPRWFYEKTLEMASPLDFYDEMDVVKNRLGKKEQFEGFGFTHPTGSINAGPKVTSYKKLVSMENKLRAQMRIAKVVRANDEADIARRVLSSHFTPDILGNLRAFSTQTFRCVKCSEAFRRPPLTGKCPRCHGKVVLNVTRGGITKYLPLALELAKSYDLGNYTKQRMELVAEYVKSLTDNPRRRQRTLVEFMSNAN
ncbi:MAG: hypothetical protein Kow0069_34440 [Promethearchaeota archaeon]